MPRDAGFPVHASNLAVELGVAVSTIVNYGHLCGAGGRRRCYTASQADAIRAIRAARTATPRGPISAGALAAEIGVSRSMVGRCSQQLGYPMGVGYAARQAEAIREATSAATAPRITGAALARELGVMPNTIIQHARRLGLSGGGYSPEAAARIRASIEASPRVALARECRSAR